MFIFLDESGDLGFDFSKKATSKIFVITLLVCDSVEVQSGFRQAVRRTLKNKLNHPKSKRQILELKGESTSIEIKQYFIQRAPTKGWALYSVILNKKRIYNNLRTPQAKKRLYNYLARFLLEKVKFSNNLEKLNLIVDRCKNADDMADFNEYIASHLGTIIPFKTKLYISHEDSKNNTGLQAVDMFCWGITRKHHLHDKEWYEKFKKHILLERIYLPKK